MLILSIQMDLLTSFQNELRTAARESSRRTAWNQKKRKIGYQGGRSCDKDRHRDLTDIMKHSTKHTAKPDILFCNHFSK